jgi:hypothetical protein
MASPLHDSARASQRVKTARRRNLQLSPARPLVVSPAQAQLAYWPDLDTNAWVARPKMVKYAVRMG